jgi:hypothetical protein
VDELSICEGCLDLYGTSHHPRIWHDPKTFDPDRLRRAPSAFEFVPQGAGDAALKRRCPGEEITVQLMKADVTLLTSSILAKRVGLRKAKAAVARKLAVIMHRMWTDGTDFSGRPTRSLPNQRSAAEFPHNERVRCPCRDVGGGEIVRFFARLDLGTAFATLSASVSLNAIMQPRSAKPQTDAKTASTSHGGAP